MACIGHRVAASLDGWSAEAIATESVSEVTTSRSRVVSPLARVQGEVFMKMSRVLALGAAVLIIPALAACGSSSSSSDSTSAATASAVAPVAPLPTGGAELADTSWVLSGMSSTNTSMADSGVTMAFTATDVSGNSGVNTYSGTYTSSTDGKLAFGALAGTMMAGDEAKMKIEADYLAALATVTGYSVNGDLLDLFAGPDQILTYTKK
jgi:heat shock protein HslJ